MSDRQKKNRTRKPVYDFRALSFYGCCFRECYAVERHFRGYQTDDFDVTEPVDRTIVHLLGSDTLVLIYNKHREEERLEVKERAFREENYILKPLASIPEMNLDIYSRCIVCRMNAEGVFESVCESDYEIWGRYLAP